MKQYVYKIQWVFSITNDFVIPKNQLRKNLYNVIRAIGAKSLTTINFLDKNYNKVDSYSNMIMYGFNLADDEAIKYIKKVLKKNKEITMVELLRKN